MAPRVLFIDDDATTLETLNEVLTTRLPDIAVDTCESATAALDIIAAVDYDAIVSDIKMPGMDGLDLMQRILKLRPTTPTLLVTGHGDRDLGVNALEAGAYAFIQKPIDREYFVAWLKRAIQLRQLSRAVEQHTVKLEQTVQQRTAELEHANHDLKQALQQQQEGEAILRKSEERYRHLYESIDEGFCIIEVMFGGNKKAVDYVFLEVNPSFEKQTGIQHARGRGMREIAPHHEDHWFELYGKIALTGESRRFEYPAVGLHRWYEGYAYRIGEAHERKVAIIFNDITERKQAEEDVLRLLAEVQQREHELRHKQDQLVQAAKLASLGEMASGIAHEINNPLNNIGLFIGNALDLLESAKLDRTMTLQQLRAAAGQVKKAATIVNHMRTFARASTSYEVVSLNAVLRSTVAVVEEQLQMRNIDLKVEWAPGEPIVKGNAIQLEQVFVNLLGNARDAVERSPRKRIAIRSLVKGSNVEVTVVDTGIGISGELQARIFDPFFTTKDAGKGTGLGLSISYGIIKEHGGTIAVSSRPGDGATFTVTLPLSEKLTAEQRPGA